MDRLEAELAEEHELRLAQAERSQQLRDDIEAAIDRYNAPMEDRVMIPRNHQVTEIREGEQPVNAETREMLADARRRGFVDERWSDVILANNARAAADEAAAEGPTDEDAAQTSMIRKVPNEPTVIQGPADRGDVPVEVGSDDCCDDETDQ